MTCFQLGRAVPPRPIIAGEPLLTMRGVSSLEELAPWFSTLSLSLTRQQTRSMASTRTSSTRSPLDTIERIIEIDFMEEISSQTLLFHTHQISSIVKLLCLISVIKIFSIYLINIYLKNDDAIELIFISIICRLFLPTNHLSTLLPIPTTTFLVWSYNICLLIQKNFKLQN